MFAFAKNRELHAKLENYFEVAWLTFETFREAIGHLIKNNIDEHFRMLARKTHKHESNADDIRRGIELDMYEKSLLPDTREDLLVILESIDKIPNECECLLNMIITQKTELYKKIDQPFSELLKISGETFEHTIEAARDCFGKRRKTRELNRLVDDNESIGDSLEWQMVAKIFESKLDTGDKILQKEIVHRLGSICDFCESTLDRIVICSVKRAL